jgi:hypothetical protein
MSVTLTDDQIRDLATGTLKKMGRLKFNQIAQRLPDYEVMSRIMKRDKVKFDDGNGITRYLMVKTSGAARNVGLYEPDQVNVGTVLEEVTIPWRHSTTNYSYDRRELAMNAGESKVVDLLKSRRVDALISQAELMEHDFWSKPESIADKKPIFGIMYWIVKNVTLGFNGGAPTGFSGGAGGLVHDNWKNYTGQYAAVSKTDLIAKMRKAYRQCRFKSPVDVTDYRRKGGPGDKYRIYMNEDTIETFENVAENQNDNLGRDVASMDDSVVFKKNPIRWIPFLDDDTTDPVYMLNWEWFEPVFLKGEYMRESKPTQSPTQHTVDVVHIDTTWNLLCTNRREQAVFSK